MVNVSALDLTLPRLGRRCTLDPVALEKKDELDDSIRVEKLYSLGDLTNLNIFQLVQEV